MAGLYKATFFFARGLIAVNELALEGARTIGFA
jgi:hypothetical protein